jgi:hypothetical protein
LDDPAQKDDVRWLDTLRVEADVLENREIQPDRSDVSDRADGQVVKGLSALC